MKQRQHLQDLNYISLFQAFTRPSYSTSLSRVKCYDSIPLYGPSHSKHVSLYVQSQAHSLMSRVTCHNTAPFYTDGKAGHNNFSPRGVTQQDLGNILQRPQHLRKIINIFSLSHLHTTSSPSSSTPCAACSCHLCAREETNGGRTGLLSRIRSISAMCSVFSFGSTCVGTETINQLRQYLRRNGDQSINLTVLDVQDPKEMVVPAWGRSSINQSINSRHTSPEMVIKENSMLGLTNYALLFILFSHRWKIEIALTQRGM